MTGDRRQRDRTPDAALLRLAHEVADGRRVDWTRHRTTDPALAAAIQGLETIAALAATMRREPAVGHPAPDGAPPRSEHELEPGQVLGRFRVESEAGRGGMGIVYRARDEVLDRAVALKLLPTRVARSPERLARFTREAKLLASLNHPNLATIHGMEENDAGLCYLVLEWVPGETLARRLEHGPLPLSSALDVCLQIAEALQAAHEGGVIHRDLKPGNVIVTPQGRAKVLDFGLARTVGEPPTGENTGPSDLRVAGTWGYVSPECFTGDDDHRADLFAFGCVLYECLAGIPAFPGASADEILIALLEREPDPARLPAGTPSEVRDLIAQCVVKDPNRRLASIAGAVHTLAIALGRDPLGPSPIAHAPTLPRPATSFIGRGREIEQCRTLLRTNRVLTLTGAGGSGKTRLAIALASAVADNYAGGITFTDLSSVQDGDRVVDALARSLGEREDAASPLLARISARLKAAGTLVILDNCEHVLTASAELVTALIATCPRLTVLTTSREPLRVHGEQVLTVTPLQVPGAGDLADPAALARCEAVSLFLDRARSADPEFSPDEATLRSVAEICRRVEGLPLAIELAAARRRVLSTAEIAARLDRQLLLLRDASAMPTDRHQAMHLTIEWSTQQLRPEEARVFRLLAVFTGGWDLESATQVCDERGDEFKVLDLISRLVDKSLVCVERRQGEPARYRFLEPLHQFALEALAASGEEPLARRRHLATFLALAERAEPELFRSEQSRWLARLDAEHENVLAALEECERAPGGAEAALRIVSSLHRFWSLRGHFRIGEAAIERALARVGPSTPEELHAEALLARGLLVLVLGRHTVAPDVPVDPDALRRMFAVPLEMFRRLGDRRGIARCLNSIGLEHIAHRDFAAGRSALEEACAHYRALGNTSGLAGAMNNMGLAAWRERDIDTARRLIGESHALLKGKGDLHFVAIMTINLAFLALRQGDRAEARSLLVDALRYVRDSRVKTDSALGALLCAAELASLSGADRSQAVRADRSQAARAAWLFGAVQTVLDDLGATLGDSHPYGHEYAASRERARRSLGDGDYAAAFEEGRAASSEEAIARALAELETPAASNPMG